MWCNGSIRDLGVVDPCQNSTATSVNSANQVVGGLGVCTDDPNDPTYFSAFYTEKRKPMVDLNTLITPASEIHLTDAWNINNRGEILANGKLPDGSERVVLLVPIHRPLNNSSQRSIQPQACAREVVRAPAARLA